MNINASSCPVTCAENPEKLLLLRHGHLRTVTAADRHLHGQDGVRFLVLKATEQLQADLVGQEGNMDATEPLWWAPGRPTIRKLSLTELIRGERCLNRRENVSAGMG